MASLLQTMREGAGTQHPEEIINFLTSRFVLTSGIWDKANNEFLVEESDTPAMSVDIRQGYAFLVNSSAGMVYPVRLTTEDATVAISSNSSGNSRIDAIVLYQDLGASPNATISNVAKLVAVEGTPAASPSAPDSTTIETEIGASNPYTVLAYVTVDSGETTILDADISDQRTDATYTSKVGNIVGADGWIDADETWTYASANTFTVTGDVTGKYQKGDKIKFTQPTDGVKYAYIIDVSYSDPTTTITISESDDYDLDNEAITNPYYSKMENPQGFPQVFNWTPQFTNLTVGNGNLQGSFSINGKILRFDMALEFGSTTSISGSVSLLTPIDMSSNLKEYTLISSNGFYYDSGSSTRPGFAWKEDVGKSNVLKILVLSTSSTFGFVNATSPFTWTTNDDLHFNGEYEYEA